jgi:hypothetical protein
MPTTPWGPLAGLIGTWESGLDGLDVSFHSDQGKLGETKFCERTTFAPFGPVNVGPHPLYGLDYRTATWRDGEDTPFHTEVGYWMWDGANHQVVRCFIVPHATALIAGATVDPDATSFKLESAVGSSSYGILSTTYLHALAQTTRFDVSINIGEDSFSYEQTIVVEYQQKPTVILHTDRNVLRLVSRKV